MKPISLIVCFLLFAITNSIYGQKISETNFGLGISKTSLTSQSMQWGETTAPAYLKFTATKSWHNNDHRFSLRKEAGLNLQYSNINFETGGLAASNHYTGTIFSLFADAALLARFSVSNAFAIGIGPEAEILLIGRNNLNNSYYNMLNPSNAISGNERTKGVNRDFFNKPGYGIKLSLFETGISERAAISINFSYLWTKNEYSSFYTGNYARIGLSIGFKKGKKKLEQPTEELPTAPKVPTE
jgi:hypothetical protein